MCVCVRACVRACVRVRDIFTQTTVTNNGEKNTGTHCDNKRVIRTRKKKEGGEEWKKESWETGEKERETKTGKQNSNSNSKILFYKDCNLGSFKNLSNN